MNLSLIFTCNYGMPTSIMYNIMIPTLSKESLITLSKNSK